MPSFTTIFRAIVMVAIGAAVFKGWQLYGPSTEQVKTFAVRATEIAQSAWKDHQAKNKNEDLQPPADPRSAAPPFAQTMQPPAAVAAPPLTVAAQPLNQSVNVMPSTTVPPVEAAPITPVAKAAPPAATSGGDDRVHALLSRLEQLGGADPTVAPWGSSGRLFRCCCQAPLGNSPAVTRHFESVAAEPALAVKQVVAQVEAWQAARRDGGLLR
jgi:hypothetical protein